MGWCSDGLDAYIFFLLVIGETGHTKINIYIYIYIYIWKAWELLSLDKVSG